MSELILDTLDNRNNIGSTIATEMSKCTNSAYIVSPYVSENENTAGFKFKTSHIKKIRIICQAESRSCNPYTLERLIKHKNISVMSINNIHAKVYIFDDSAFISSANATPNGLGSGSIEAAVKITNTDLIDETKQWFDVLWSDDSAKNVADFDREKWEELKAKFRINENSEQKQKLSDLLIAKEVPGNISFVFWYDIDDFPAKEKVEKLAKKAFGVGLPENIDNWDYWVEGEIQSDDNSEYELLEKTLKKHLNKTVINFKTSEDFFDDNKTNKIYKSERFVSIFLDRPLKYEWKNKTYLLSLYRKNKINCNFKIDDKAIEILNKSIQDNRKEWKKYFSSDEGKFNYCTAKQLYKLLKGCYV